MPPAAPGPPPDPSRGAKRHIQEARENYDRYSRLLAAGDASWALVLLFYSALHLVQADAVVRNEKGRGPAPPVDHTERRAYVAHHASRIYPPYTRLLGASRG